MLASKSASGMFIQCSCTHIQCSIAKPCCHTFSSWVRRSSGCGTWKLSRVSFLAKINAMLISNLHCCELHTDWHQYIKFVCSHKTLPKQLFLKNNEVKWFKMPSLRLLQAEVFVCTLVSWCSQCACTFGITGQHFCTEDENFFHLKCIALLRVISSVAACHLQWCTPSQEYRASHSQQTQTPKQSKLET